MRGVRVYRAIVVAVALLACMYTRALAQDQTAPRARLGTKIPNLTFHDANGNRAALYDQKDRKAIAIVFLSFECPVSNSYCALLTDLVKEYGKHGVSVIGLTVNEDDTRADVAKYAKDFNLNFPVYRDDKLLAADALAATCTPEVLLLDSDYVLRYRGRIDDAYSERLKKHNLVKTHNLKQAIGE